VDVRDALQQIEAIHGHLARTEVYRGFRARALALVGLLAFLAAWVQPWVVTEGDETGFIGYWSCMAAGCGMLGAGAALKTYLVAEDDFVRRQTRQVAGQFLPCVAAGAVVTVCLLRGGPGCTAWLPGLWAMLFGLGVLAARPYLPRPVGAVALFYLGCGTVLLGRAASGAAPSSWSVGAPFGLGHLLTAAALHLEPESRDA
jgi:hypothetical protein